MQTMSYYSKTKNKNNHARCNARLDFAQAGFSAICAHSLWYKMETFREGRGKNRSSRDL